MPFQYKRKKESHGTTSADVMAQAVKKVLNGAKIREMAKTFNIPRGTLQRYIKKARKEGPDHCKFAHNYQHPMVFTEKQEKELADYIETASRMHHGLTTAATRQFAYVCWVSKKEFNLDILCI